MRKGFTCVQQPQPRPEHSSLPFLTACSPDFRLVHPDPTVTEINSLICILPFLLLFFFLAMPHCLQDLSSLTRD